MMGGRHDKPQRAAGCLKVEQAPRFQALSLLRLFPVKQRLTGMRDTG